MKSINMTSSRTINAKRNIISAIFNKLIIIFAPFLIRTIIIYTLGSQYTGVSSLFTSILQVLNISELGLGSVIAYVMYKPIAENDISKVNALLNLYRKLYRIIGCIILGLGVCISPFLRFLIKDANELPFNFLELEIIYFIYLFNSVISYFLFSYKSCLLTANQRNDIVALINTFVYLFGYSFQIIILLLFRHSVHKYVYIGYLSILPIITICCNLLNAYICKKKFPQYKCSGKIEKETGQLIKKQVKGLVIGRICGILRNSVDNIFISLFLGTFYLTLYGNYLYIMNAVHVLISSISVSIVAVVGNSIVSETKEKNYNDFNKILLIYSLLSSVCTTILLCLYQPFMGFWMRGDKSLVANISTVFLFVAYFYVLTINDIRCVYMDALGLWWENRWRPIIEIVSNICLNLILVQFLGINGILIATIFSTFVVNFTMSNYVLFKHYFGLDKIKEFYVKMFTYFVITVFVSAFCYLISGNVFKTGNEFGDLFIQFVLIAFVSFALCLALYSLTNTFNDSLTLAKRFLFRRKKK